MEPEPTTDIVDARVLALFGDSITTDHISPAGSIKESSPAGQWLKANNVGKAEGGNGMGVFIRTGTGKRDIKHLYGLSVDQVFNSVSDTIAPDVEAELEAALLRQARYEFAKALGKTP